MLTDSNYTSWRENLIMCVTVEPLCSIHVTSISTVLQKKKKMKKQTTDWEEIISVHMYLIKDLNLKYLKNSYNTIIRQTAKFKNGQKVCICS